MVSSWNGRTSPELGGKFSSPEEEIAYLRAQIEATKVRESEIPRATLEQVSSYKEKSAEMVLAPDYRIKEHEIESHVLQVGKEHEAAIDELVRVMMARGIKNTLTILEKLNDPRLEDDFHRFLVQFLSEGRVPDAVLKDKALFRALRMRLYEVTVPFIQEKEEKKSFADLVTAMERLYASLLSLENTQAGFFDIKNYFALEIAVSNASSEIVFYAAVPVEHASLFEKQMLAAYPHAKLREHKEDYNPFNSKGVTLMSIAEPLGNAAFPIRTFDAFPEDPLSGILGAFTNMKHEGEGASVQIIIQPQGQSLNEAYRMAREEMKSGVSVKTALQSPFRSILGALGEGVKELVVGVKERDDKSVDQESIEFITQKISSPVVAANIRIVASAETDERARAMLTELESAFNQFTRPQANGFKWKRAVGSDMLKMVHQYSFRTFDERQALHLNLKELATVYHFPVTSLLSPGLKEAKAGTAPAPVDIPSAGTVLGVNAYHGRETFARLSREDRVRHMYVIGQTGTGKSSILKNMILQDIRNGDGCCFIDPHGSDVQDILSLIPPERMKDVIYFDPAHVARPMGLNMLEYDARYPEQKTFVVNEMMNIFNQLFDMKVGGGPMFEQYFKNAAFLVMEDPESGSTLLEISRVLADKEFRDMKLARCQNPIIKQFWASAEKTTGDQGLANFVPYISSKFDNFISNDIMRPIVLQQKSVFNFRSIMDEKKILLVNLSKGRLGDINANLIGLVLVGKITMAALSRVDMFASGQKPNDFYLYIDEFQNVTTPSIATILSEARKYRLSLNVAHQYISQLTDEIKNAVFGNVGNMAIFRVGPEDAKFLEAKLAPVFTADDITKLDNFNAYLSILVNGQPSKPFNIKALPPEQGNTAQAEKLKELSYLMYGSPREEVEAEIFGRFHKG